MKKIGLLLLTAMALHVNLLAEDSAPNSPEQIRPILVGTQAPDVQLATQEGKTVSLSAFWAKKPSVLIFYRGGWCPYCNTQLGQLRKAEGELKKLGYQVLAISPDRPQKLSETIEKQKPGYTLLSDSAMKASLAFGIAFKVDDATIDKYKEYHIDLEESSGEKHHLLPVPAVFIIDRKGIVQFQYVNPDYKTRLHPDLLVAAARILRDPKK